MKTKIKIFSVLIGSINGGFLSITPLMLYNYLLNKNLDISGGTDIALIGALVIIFIILIINIFVITLTYILSSKESPKIKVFLFVFIGWMVGIVVLILFERFNIFFESESNLRGAFVLLCSILNFISIIISIPIAKLVIKISTQKNVGSENI